MTWLCASEIIFGKSTISLYNVVAKGPIIAQNDDEEMAVSCISSYMNYEYCYKCIKYHCLYFLELYMFQQESQGSKCCFV